METNPVRWIAALRHSHDTLAGLAGSLGSDALESPSYDDGWPIAQVLGHLGSQAEIFGLFLDAGLNGTQPPGQDAFAPIWQAWDARSHQQRAADALRADAKLTQRLESLDPRQREEFQLSVFGMELGTTGLVQLRLGEHALHTWDIAVMLDPAATLLPAAVDLLIDAYDEAAASRAASPDGKQRRLAVSTSGPTRHFILKTGDGISMETVEGHEGRPDLKLPAEAFLRLVAGRLDPDHTPASVTGEHHLRELRPIFPGF